MAEVESVECLASQSGREWTLFHGDSCQILQDLPDNSVDLTVHSPPFSNLYVYSESEADLGNCSSDEEFFEHYSFVIRELYRVTTPGRLVVIHCKDLPAYYGRDDYAGLREFPDMCLQAFKAAGFAYHSRVTIWKCPVIERARTNSYGLLHQQLCKDSAASRQGMPDYLIVCRKWDDMSPQDFPKPVQHPVGGKSDEPWRFDGYVGDEPPDVRRDDVGARDYSIQVWQRYASPVWFDIRQTNVLQYEQARDDKDERHICPLQLDVIERCIDLWSMPGDVVLDPFNGIGSTGVCALKHGRKYVGIELKESYFRQAVKSLKGEEAKKAQKRLF